MSEHWGQRGRLDRSAAEADAWIARRRRRRESLALLRSAGLTVVAVELLVGLALLFEVGIYRP